MSIDLCLASKDLQFAVLLSIISCFVVTYLYELFIFLLIWFHASDLNVFLLLTNSSWFFIKIHPNHWEYSKLLFCLLQSYHLVYFWLKHLTIWLSAWIYWIFCSLICQLYHLLFLQIQNGWIDSECSLLFINLLFGLKIL